MKKISILLLFLSSFVFAQNQEEEKIKTVINNFFGAMKNSDSVRVKNAFTSSAIFQLIDENGVFQQDSPAGFAKYVGTTPKLDLVENATSWKISVDGKMANAWVGYEFYYQKKFTHCGIDNFILLKDKEEWKIHYLIFTMKKEGCGK